MIFTQILFSLFSLSFSSSACSGSANDLGFQGDRTQILNLSQKSIQCEAQVDGKTVVSSSKVALQISRCPDSPVLGSVNLFGSQQSIKNITPTEDGFQMMTYQEDSAGMLCKTLPSYTCEYENGEQKFGPIQIALIGEDIATFSMDEFESADFQVSAAGGFSYFYDAQGIKTVAVEYFQLEDNQLGIYLYTKKTIPDLPNYISLLGSDLSSYYKCSHVD